MATVRVSRELVEIQSLLLDAKLHVSRAVVNMRAWSVSGLPTTTPGSGSPGGGKGGGRTIVIGDDRLPTSSTEASAIAPELDVASIRLAELVTVAGVCARAGSDVVEQFVGQRPVAPSFEAGAVRLVQHGWRCARVLAELDVAESWRPIGGWHSWSMSARRLWQITGAWGTVPAVPAKPDAAVRGELLANDLTGNRCRSCLRVGEIVDRDRSDRRQSELCSWCRKFLASEGFLPPVSILEHRHAGKTVTEQMVAPFRQAHRERLKAEQQQTNKRRRRR